MNISKFLAIPVVIFVVTACSSDQSDNASTPNSVIQQDGGDEVCNSAGVTHLPRAARYDASFNISGNSPTYVNSNGVFSFDAPFAYTNVTKVVDALASYGDTLTAEEGKVLRVRFTGGIANRKHDTEEFKLFLAYKLDGQDQAVEMNWHPSPTTTYTAYMLDFIVPTIDGASLDIWFEGRFVENGNEKRIYDSRGGANYKVKIVGNASKSLCFDSGWREALKGGELKAGDSVELVYDVKRLLDRMNGRTYASWPAWNAYAHYKILDKNGNQIDAGKLPLSASAYDPANGGASTVRPSYKPLMAIPAAAKGGKLVLWFEGPNRGNTVWDSDYDNNYEISLK